MSPNILNLFLQEARSRCVSDQDTIFILNSDGIAERSRQFNTIILLKELFDNGIAVPGSPGDTFTPWEKPYEAWIDRVIDLFEEYNWEPRGNGFFVSLTPHGGALANELFGAQTPATDCP